ncbi:GntR family transcriptional regulator [Antarctobacter sp.]|uniref:GntR family transcriptional regulator n=1 Tax=Antarctobacter sp. TaxID=1872577 RepID=UPI003A8F5547
MTVTNKTACRDALKARILSLDLAPGAELDETQIAGEYGLSRTPLREIFQVLAGEGYLRLETNRGARVTSMDLAVLRMFFQTAPLVYATTARLAAENRRSDQIAGLKETQARFLAATEGADSAAAALENHAFHRQIGEMAANPYMMPALSRMLIDHTRLSQTFYRPATKKEKKLVKKAAQQHDAMIAAIERQAPDVAVDLTLQHWDLSRDQLERFVRPDPLPLDVVRFDALKEARNNAV